jgi:hypothetical protein
MAVSKERIAQILEERKAKARQEARKQKLEARKAAVTKKPVQRTVFERKAAERKVVKETTNRKGQEPRTIKEAIKARTDKFENKAQKHLYTVLSENMVHAVRTLQEATQAGPSVTGVVDNGAGVGLMKTYFDIFFGYFPNLIVPEIASTQPIKTEKAMVFYYQTVAGSTKGDVTKGDVLISPFKINTDKDYTSQTINLAKVSADTLTIDGTGPAYDYSSGTIALWGPFIGKSVVLENATLVWSSDTEFTGTLDDNGTDVAITAGLVTISGSEITVTMKFASLPTTTPKLSYVYDNKYAPTQVPELNANIDSRDIVAQARTVKTNYSFQAGFGFEAQFGVKLEDKLAESAMYELKREADLDFVFEIMNAAPVQIVWNKAAGVANGLYEFHKQSFRDAIVGASNHIFKVSKRVRGNVLLVGPAAQSIVETLPDFKGSDFGSQIGGPSVIGKLKDIKVIAIPDLADNDWAVIYKNEKDNLDAGIIFAPYIPVVATTPVTLDDMVIRRAYTMSYGKLVTNADYFVKGSIINNPMAQPVYLISKDGTDTALGTIGDDAYEATAPGMPA